MTKDAFIAKYLDETIGMLLASFAASEGTRHKAAEESWAADGKFMMQQMRRAKDLLGRIWDDMHPKKDLAK